MRTIPRLVKAALIISLLSAIMSTAPVAATAPQSPSNLQWHSCYQRLQQALWPDEFASQFGGPVRFECTTVQVPLDYDGDTGGTINLGVVRIPALDQSGRIGSLFSNPGGPGGSGIGFTLFSAPFAFGPELRSQFDIVGFDPRGILFSTAARCYGNERQAEGDLSGIVVPRTDDEITTWLDSDADIQEACAQRGSRILEHMSSANAARDLDVLREAVGDEQLTYAGFSYGTLLGATYANLFPDNIRAMMLDSALDAEAWTSGAPGEQDVPMTARLGSHVGSQDSLERFFELCTAAGPDFCPIANDAGGRWTAVLDALDEEPLVFEFPVFDRRGRVVGVEVFEFGADEFLGETVGILYAGDFWPIISFITADLEALLAGPPPGPFAAQFASDIAALRAGEANSFATRAGVDFNRPPNYFNFIEGFVGVLCADSDNPDDIGAWSSTADELDETSFFGGFWTWGSSVCNGWPAADEDRYAGPWDAETSNTILIMNNEFDPATPLGGAERLDALLADSALLVVEDGRGHIASQWSGCAAASAAFYLLTTEIPADLTCPPDVENPFDLFGPPPLARVILPDGTEAIVILVEGPEPDLPVALDPETGEPLNIDPETGEVLPIEILEIL